MNHGTITLEPGLISQDTECTLEAPTMKDSILRILKNHGFDPTTCLGDPGFHLRLENSPYMPLTIERVGFCPDLLAVSHHYIQNGDLMYDPEIVFDLQGVYGTDWLPHSITQHPLGVYHEFLMHDPQTGAVATWNRRGVADCYALVKVWAQNLMAQGWHDPARAVVKRFCLNGREMDAEHAHAGTAYVGSLAGRGATKPYAAYREKEMT